MQTMEYIKKAIKDLFTDRKTWATIGSKWNIRNVKKTEKMKTEKEIKNDYISGHPDGDILGT